MDAVGNILQPTMDTLADILEPHKESIGFIAMVVTIGQMFSGSLLCVDIYKKGKSEGVAIMPFVGGLVMSVLNLKYGYMIRDDTMIKVNFVGIALNLIYLMIYYQFSSRKMVVWVQFGIATALSAALVMYADAEDPKYAESRFGLIITAFMFGLIASPLFDLKKIIKSQSTEGMPFPIIASGTVVTFMWLLYGIALRNGFIVVQNVVAFSLCAVQISLFVIYPSKPKSLQKTKSKSKKID